MCAFRDTANKATIRQQWDRPILERYFRAQGRLTYLGLPGPDIHDLLDWSALLHEHRTGVESPGRTKKERYEADQTIGRLNFNVMANNLGSGFQLLVADVEDVIIDGIDSKGVPPQINDGRAAHLARFGYDLVNLDFDGGLGYVNQYGAARRVEAIKKLFERQEGHTFVLFLTINVRDTLGNEIEDYLRGLRVRDRGVGWQDTIDWYINRPDGEREYKLKAVVPSFIHVAAELHKFRSICRPPIAYEGHERAHMLHYVFELESTQTNLRAFSDQDDRDLVELPLLRCDSGSLWLPPHQHPTFNPTQCESYLEFLPDETRKAITQTLADGVPSSGEELER